MRTKRQRKERRQCTPSVDETMLALNRKVNCNDARTSDPAAALAVEMATQRARGLAVAAYLGAAL
ncbi:hypothetical protein [Streptomyces sp. cg35]|uniref:hypothetical protein n=1 Tax=Streptomyces sp. cg35 TaxID=3421650 RepID=UPI003D1756FC